MENGKPDRNEMTIDERLKSLLQSTEYLRQSTESLHDQMAQFIAEGRQRIEEERQLAREHEQRMARTEAAEKAHRQAIVAAIYAYLKELGS